jgi:hypothetical protein
MNQAEILVYPRVNKVDTSTNFHDQLKLVKEKTVHHVEINPYDEGMIKRSDKGLRNEVTLLIILCFIGLAYTRSFYRKRFKLLTKIVFNWKIAKQIIRYEKVYTHPVNLILTSIFLIISPLLFALHLHSSRELPFSVEQIYLWLGLGVIVFLVTKLGLHYFFSWLFQLKDAFEEYIFQSSLVNKIYGIINLVLLNCYLFLYSTDRVFIQISLISLLLLLGLQYIRGVLIGFQNGISIQYIILYLCTLEILPWLILIKWINYQLN